MKLIINADDLGLNPTVNSAIEEALQARAISSSTIMANSQYIKDVKAIVAKFPDASFGVHLNLTEGPSLTKDETLHKYGIIDSDGCFIKDNYTNCFNPNEEIKKAIEEEWDAQISLLQSEGFCLSHADGHHHCHTWPGLEQILMPLLKKHQINRTRNRYKYPNISAKSKFQSAVLGVCYHLPHKFFPQYQEVFSNMRLFKNYQMALTSNGIKSTDYFGQYLTFVDLLKANPTWKQDVVIECMCHPGNPVYPTEFDVLKRSEVFLDNSIDLISYKEL